MAAAAITYQYPATVSASTPPTPAQMAQRNLVGATAVFVDGATVATITHNLNITAADLTLGFPRITVTELAAGAALNNAIVAVVDANNITIAQTLGSANTGATYKVWIDRVNTNSR